MSKKSFKDTNPAIAFISKPEVKTEDKDESETSGNEKVLSENSTHNTQDVQEVQSTQEQEDIAYLRLISRIRGISMTQYVNDLLDEDREDNDDVIKKAEKLLEM